MHVGLPAQLSRQLAIAIPLGRVAPIGEAAAVDAFFTARLFKRLVRLLRPRLASLL